MTTDGQETWCAFHVMYDECRLRPAGRLPEEGGDVSGSQTPMSLIRYYDPVQGRDRLEVRDVRPEVTFTQELLDQADGERLIYAGETITVNVDNGKWIWRVVEVDHHARTVLGRWPD